MWYHRLRGEVYIIDSFLPSRKSSVFTDADQAYGFGEELKGGDF